MIRFLLDRPVSLLMSFAALLILGTIVVPKIPVSLLPNVDVPQISVRIMQPNMSAEELELEVVRHVRDRLSSLGGLKRLESSVTDHTGTVRLYFEYGTRMGLAYIEANEKLDRLSAQLPAGVARPQVVQSSISDIPIIRLQVIPQSPDQLSATSELASKVLKRRLEQIEGVSFVDINGMQEESIAIAPDQHLLGSLGMTSADLSEAIRAANIPLSGMHVKEGQYRYFIQINNRLGTLQDIGNIPVGTPSGNLLQLRQLATIKTVPGLQSGSHLFNGKACVVLTVQKQPDSRMNKVIPLIEESVRQFKSDYPGITFHTTQDQSFLLDAGIDNLYQDILIGGAMVILLLFLFLGNWASPLVMSISIPVSLIITFLFFYLFGLSFNIISLSGLALGIGMLIDNSIVVIDHITRKHQAGHDLAESSVSGVSEMTAPVISQVLTTVVVYAPLIILSGLASYLILDQSIALTISLAVSLLVAFLLAPMIYKLLLRRWPAQVRNDDTRFYIWVAGGYHRLVDFVLKHRNICLIITIALMPVGFLIATILPIQSIPDIRRQDGLLTIDWNEAIDAQENARRMQELDAFIGHAATTREAEVGLQQFLFAADNNSIQKAEYYYSCTTETGRQVVEKKLQQWLRANHPFALINIGEAPNAFTHLFKDATPYLEARFKPVSGVHSKDPFGQLNKLLKGFPANGYVAGEGLAREPSLAYSLDYPRLMLYGITPEKADEALLEIFGPGEISSLQQMGNTRKIRLTHSSRSLKDHLDHELISKTGQQYRLGDFLSFSESDKYKYITADRAGEYKSIIAPSGTNVAPWMAEVRRLAELEGFVVEFAGRYFQDSTRIQEMAIAFFLVLLLLYLVLAIQFESLIQPLIVMLTIPLGITGSMFVLWITGSNINVMAAVGFIVVLGLIVDDPILKVETLNRLSKKYAAENRPINDALLKSMVHEAGDICLKPLLLVSLTTSIAMVPVLLSDGIGNEIQRPMAWVIIGGLTIGTFFTTWFIPLAFWYTFKSRISK